jgi:hypothetical protein
MSSILEEAVIHANTLREAAIKNAEQIVIEKYSADIKDAVEKLLEGTEEVIDSIPYAHEELLTKEDVSKPVEIPLKDVTGKEELQEELEIDMDQVKSLLSEESEALDEITWNDDDVDPFADDDDEEEADDYWDVAINKMKKGEKFDLQSALSGEPSEDDTVEEDQAGGEYEEEYSLEEEGDTYHIGYEEEEEGHLEEAIQFNTKVVPTGWLGANHSTLGEAELVDIVARIAEESMKEEREANKKELAKKQKEQEDLKAELAESNKKLNQLTQVVQSLKDKLVESNTTNGKLFYTNCVLKDPSLNERQKEKLVESLSNAESLEQAKVIYETLNSVGSTNGGSQKPKSLSEALNRNSSLVISARRTEEKREADPLYNSWKKLAGL